MRSLRHSCATRRFISLALVSTIARDIFRLSGAQAPAGYPVTVTFSVLTAPSAEGHPLSAVGYFKVLGIPDSRSR